MDLSSQFKIGSLVRSKVVDLLKQDNYLVYTAKLSPQSLRLRLAMQLKAQLEQTVSGTNIDIESSFKEMYDLLDALAGSFSLTKERINTVRSLYRQLYGTYRNAQQITRIEPLTDELKAKLEEEASLLRSASRAAEKAAKSRSFDSTGVNAFFEEAYQEK